MKEDLFERISIEECNKLFANTLEDIRAIKERREKQEAYATYLTSIKRISFVVLIYGICLMMSNIIFSISGMYANEQYSFIRMMINIILCIICMVAIIFSGLKIRRYNVGLLIVYMLLYGFLFINEMNKAYAAYVMTKQQFCEMFGIMPLSMWIMLISIMFIYIIFSNADINRLIKVSVIVFVGLFVFNIILSEISISDYIATRSYSYVYIISFILHYIIIRKCEYDNEE